MTAHTNQFAILQRKNVVRSTTNPRTHFDPAYIQELAESIKDHGVIQPILVRPLPASRVPDTPRNVTHEIVCGECRDRGSEAAGVDTIPVMIKELNDNQVLEIQLVENLKRRDLTELEEALGYETLMQHAAISADQVGEKIGKSRSYVYGRLKLLDLCSEARGSLRDGTIDASRALLVARIPDHKLQIKAMKEIVAGSNYFGNSVREPMTHRQAATHVQQNYMLKLGEAKFKIENVDLVPAAGSCKTCPKRTGHDPDLFSDVKGADVCTDPPCFHKKEEAHAAALVKEATDKGQTVIAGKEAQELRSSTSSKFVGYRRLDAVDDSPTDQPLRKIIGPIMKAEGYTPVLIESTRTGELVACLPNEVALKLLKMAEQQAAAASQQAANAPKISKEVQKLVDDKKAKAEAKAKAQYEREWRANLVADSWTAMRDDADIKGFTTEVHRFLAVRAARNLSGEDASAIAKLLRLGKIALGSAVVEFAQETVNPQLLQLLIIMQEASGTETHTYGGRVPNEGLLLVAGNVFGNQLDDVIKEIKLEAKANIWPTIAKNAKLATAPAARPQEGAGGSKVEAKGKSAAAKKAAPRVAKMSAEEATLGIAAAMQGIEGAASAPEGAVALPAEPVKNPPMPAQIADFTVGQAVRITTSTDKLRIKHGKYSGKVGTITGVDVGGKELDVKVGRGTRCFEPGELERVAA